MPSILDEMLQSISDGKLKEMVDEVIATKGDTPILNIYRELGSPKHSAIVPLKDCAQAVISKHDGDLYILNVVRSAKMPHTLVWDKASGLFDLDAYIQNKHEAGQTRKSVDELFTEEEDAKTRADSKPAHHFTDDQISEEDARRSGLTT